MSIPPSSDLVTGSAPQAAGQPTPATVGPRPKPARPSDHAAVPAERADAVEAAVRAVPGVVDMHTGAFGEVATYLPGRRVAGVRLLPDLCEVHVVLAWGSPVRDAAAAIRAAVATAGVHTRVDVTIEDVVAPDAASQSRSKAIPIAAPAAIEAPPDPSAASKETL